MKGKGEKVRKVMRGKDENEKEGGDMIGGREG